MLGDGIEPADAPKSSTAYDGLPGDIGSRYRSARSTLGRRVRIELPGDDEIVGTAIDVEPDGQLVLIDDCAITHRLSAGDVVHLRAT